MPETKVTGGVLIIGSLFWDPHEIRRAWREKSLDMSKAQLIPLPIRYGKISSERMFTHTMVFSQACKKKTHLGSGYVVPFRNNISDVNDLADQAQEIIAAEIKKVPDFKRYNWGWGTLAMAINPKSMEDAGKKKSLDTFLGHWASKIGAGFNSDEYKVGNEMPILNRSAHLLIDWPEQLAKYDFVIATATKPEVRYPEPDEIGYRMVLNDYENYFVENRKAGIRTFQDEEIEERLKIKGMDILNLIARSSLHLIMTNPSNLEPEGFGSCCLVHYKKRCFLLSVAHVTDIKGLDACLETNLPMKDLQSQLYCVGSMVYFDQYKLPDNIRQLEIKTFDDLGAIYDDTLDVTFCEIKAEIKVLQPEWDFGKFVIYKGPIVYLNLEEAGAPDPEKVYGFSGRVKQDFSGALLKSQPTMKLDLQYKGTVGRFHYFIAPQIIKDPDDYRGCSGAPILDEDGKLVGLASSVKKDSNLIFGFSIEECRRLLDVAIETKLV